MKAVIWMGNSKEALMAFPADARREAGYQLDKVQRGDEPRVWKPMESVGSGVREIRIQELSGAFRVMYLAARSEGIYILHCFQKKTRKTGRGDLKLAKRRFNAIPSSVKR